MAGIVKAVFGSPPSDSPMGQRKPSMDDFSMGAHDDVNEHYGDKPTTPKGHPGDESALNTTGQQKPSTGSSAKQTWQGVLAPGKNSHANWKEVHADYYDHSRPDDPHTSADSVWDHYVRSERSRLFKEFDSNQDGFITADELHKKLGNSADVKQLIAAADADGDGKINLKEFTNLLRNS